MVVRDDGSARDFEELPRFAGLVAGSDARVVYRLGENHLEADLLTDGKTGGFLDQADNQAAVAALAPAGARALDAFTFHGGFALALARRGGAVLALDENPAAVERAAANARRNGLANLTVERANAFDLPARAGGGARHLRRGRGRSAGAGQARRRRAPALATADARLQGAHPARRAPVRAGRAAGRLLVLGTDEPRALGRDLRRTRWPTPAGQRRCSAVPAPGAITPSWPASPRPAT